MPTNQIVQVIPSIFFTAYENEFGNISLFGGALGLPEGTPVNFLFTDNFGNSKTVTLLVTGGELIATNIWSGMFGEGDVSIIATAMGVEQSGSVSLSGQNSQEPVSLTQNVLDENLMIDVQGLAPALEAGTVLTLVIRDAYDISIMVTTSVQADGTFSLQNIDPQGLSEGLLSFDVLAQDANGTLNLTNIATLLLTGSGPQGADNTLTATEDTAFVVSAAAFGYSSTQGHTLTGVKITVLPAQGTLKRNGVAVNVDDVISKADLDAGKLTYQGALNGNGVNYASFLFKVMDSRTTNNEDTTANKLTFNVTAVNDAAIISGTSTGAVTEAGGVANAIVGNPNATGTLTSTDVDGTANAFTAVSTATTSTGGYGSYTMTAAGAWGYTLNNGNTTVQALKAAQTLTDTFTVKAADGTPRVITITITGTNDAAIISGTSTGAVTEAGGVANATAGNPNATGTLTSTDVDGVANAFTAVTTAAASTGGYGTYTMTAAGVWAYTLNNGNTTVQALKAAQTLTDTFTVTAADGTSQVVTVTITGTNDAAIISGPVTGAVTEAGGVSNAIVGNPNATGTLTSTDVDGTANAFTAVSTATTSTGGYGTYTMTAAGVWAYTLNNANTTVQALAAAATLTDTFTVTAADGTAKVVTITITGSNDAAVISGTSTASLNESNAIQSASGTLTSTDVDGTANLFTAQTGVAGNNNYGTFSITTAGAWTYAMNTAHDEFVAGTNYTDKITVAAADGTTQVVTVTITGSNDAPVIVTPTYPITTLEDTAITFVISTQLAGNVTDAEGTALKGIVIVQNTSTSGTWAYSTDGTTWVDFPTTYLGAVDWTKVMYLNASDSLRYTPAANANGANLSDLNFRAVDATFPNTASGTQVSVISTIGGTGAVSNQPGHFTVSVTAVNDKPVYASDVVRTTLEDVTFEEQVSSLLAGKVTDVDSAGIAGVGITWDFGTGQSSTGTWYWADSSKLSWTAISKPAYGPSTSIFLKATDYLRFVPFTNADTSAQQGNLVVRVADDSMPVTASGSTVNLGGALPNYWSSGEHSIIVNITPVNDAPVINATSVVTMTAINEDTAAPVNGNTTAGMAVSAIFAAISDVDSVPTPVKGIAITSVNGNGTLHYSADNGVTWQAVSGLSITNALLLDANGRVYFKPNANWNGTIDNAFLYLGWDQTNAATVGSKVAISGTGGSTAYSLAVGKVGITVNAVNDAPIAVADTASIGEAGGVTNLTAGTALTSTTSGVSTLNVLANDTDIDNATSTLVVKNILKGTSGTATAVAAGTTSVNGQSIAGLYGSLVIGSDGSYTYTVDQANSTVQALNTGGSVNDVFTYTVNDPSGLTSTTTLKVTVNGTNDAPIVAVAIPDQTAVIGTAFSYTVPTGSFTDVDSTITYTATRGDGTALPTWLTFNAATRTFSGTPTDAVDFNIKVTASDGTASISDTFALGIAPVANSVAITGTTGIQNNFLNAGDTVSATVNFTELVNVTGTPQITLNIGGTLVKANYVSGSGTSALTFSYTILAGQTDANGIGINANSLGLNGGTITDAVGNNATQNFAAITDNISYKVDTTAATAVADIRNSDEDTTPITGTVATNDTNKDGSESYAIVGSAAGTYGTLTMNANGTYSYARSVVLDSIQTTAVETFTYKVTDAAGNTTQSTLTINMAPVNDAAVIGGDLLKTVNETNAAQTVTGALTITDVDSAQTFNALTGVVGTYGSFSMTTAGAWTYVMSSAQDQFKAGVAYTDLFTVSSADGTSKIVTVTINGTNDAPVVAAAIPDQTANLGEAFSYTLPAGTFSDPDSTLTYTATRGDGTALPTWLTFNAATLTFSGIPTSAIDINLKVIASDGTNSVSDVFRVFIAPAVTSLAVVSATGVVSTRLNAGDVATIEVNFIEAVTVTGTPQLALNIGGTLVQANYVSGSGGTTLTFKYTVQAGQNDANGISIDANALTLNGGTIQDVHGNNAILDTPAVTDNASFKVDTTAPVVGTLTLTDTGSSPTDGISQNGTITVGALEAGATWEYSIDNGSTWLAGSGTSFTLAAGTYAAGSVQMRETDLAGNVQTGALIAKNAADITVDQTAPLLVGSNPGDNGYLTNVANNLVLNFSETVVKGTGLIQLFKADGTLVESFDAATSTALTWSGSNLTINPTSNLLALTGYYIKVAPTALKDLAGNAYAGIADATTLNFSTTDADGGIAPTAMSGAGYVVSSAGDVNGDGFDDVIVGMPTMNNSPFTGAYLAGGAYVIYGNASGALPVLPKNASTISTSLGFKINSGISADSRFGATVSGIGDVNGDGFDDVMMGGGGTSARAYVVYGGATNAGVLIDTAGNINNSQGFKIALASGFDSTAAFGSVVTGLGDVNGDGVADFGMRVISSLANSYSYVVYGSKNNQSDLVVTGEMNQYAIGDASRGYRMPGLVTAVGDMNNDGMADVVATTYNNNDNSSAATIYYSNANGTANTTNAAYSITGTISNSPMNQVTSMGDVNGDGIADLAVMSSRQVFVVYGQTGTTNVALSTLSASQGFKIVLPVGSSRYDWISSAGDVNGDGLADVIIGKQSGYAAFAMVVYGNATGTDVQLSHILGYSSGYNVSDDAIAPSQGFKISSPDGVNRIGWRVSNAGDFNGDGLADLILGGLPTQDGLFGIVLGGTQFVTNAVQGSGTVNGTSGSEALFGSTANDTLTGGGGVDRFFAGQGDDTIVLTATDVANLANVTTGQTVKASVDGGGGFDTLRLTGGANLNLTTISNVGGMGLEENSRIESIERIDLATDTAANTLTLTARDVNDMAGFNSYNSGNGWVGLAASVQRHQLLVDGTSADMLASTDAWSYAGTATNGGKTYSVYNSISSMSQIIVDSTVQNKLNPGLSLAIVDTGLGGYAINGEAVSDYSGHKISNAGDVNGDGYDDILISSPFANVGALNDAGKAYVVFGKAGGLTGNTNIELSTVAAGVGGFAINGAAATDYTGTWSSAAGDVNGDGLADVIVSSENADLATGDNIGRGFVIYGKTSGAAVNLSAVATSEGFSINAGQSGLGYSYVGQAGDVNGDGLADLIVGAINADTGIANPGKAYVVFGRTDNSTPVNLTAVEAGVGGFVVNGPGTDVRMGVAVRSAGDFNGDGLSDLIMGADFMGSAAFSGASYIVYGKTSTTAVNLSNAGTSAFAILGQAAGDSAFRVANAGDVNGDGLADVVVGAAGTDTAAGANAGRSYVVFGKTGASGAVQLSAVAAGLGGFAINGEAAADAAGGVSYAGDINGDGLADLIVAAWGNDNLAGADAGRAYVVYGQTGTTAVNLSTVANGVGGFAINGFSAGSSVTFASYAGDLNGDGYDDLLIATPTADPAGRTDAGKTFVVFGGNQLATLVDFVGDAAANTQSGTTAAETFAAGDGNDTLIGNGGADVMSGGRGNDVFVLNASNITALSSAMGAGGNTAQQARIDGGTGADTLRLTGGASLDLTAVSNVDGMSAENTSRINSIERIDMGTDAGANTLTLTAKDVNDMAGFNLIRTGSVSADGNTWTNVSGTALSATTSDHQLVVDGSTNDTLVLSPDAGYWLNAGTVSNGTSNFNVYQNLATNSQVLVKSGVVVTNNDPNVAPVFSSINATAAAGLLPVVGGTPIWNRTTSYGISSLGGITTNITATGDSTSTNSYGTGSSAFMWIGDQQRTETLSVSFDKPVYQVKIEFASVNNDGINKDTLSFQVNGANLVLNSANLSSSETSVSGNTISGNGGGVYSITSSTAINSLSATDTISGGPSGVGIAIQYSSAPLQVSGGVAISALMPAATDADGSVVGYAITSAATETVADTTPGKWEYFNGSTWTSLSGASVSQAVYLAASTLVRWNDNDVAYTALSAVAVDNTVVATLGQALNVTTRGGATAYSSGIATLPAASFSNSAVSLALASDTGTSASDFITSNGTMNVNLSVSFNPWSYSTDSGTTWTTGSGTSFVLGAGSYAANSVQVRENGSGIQTVAKFANALTVDTAAPTVAVTMSDAALTLGEKSTVTFQFSENVANFDINDVAIQNSAGGAGAGGLSALTKVSDSKWTAVYTPVTETNTTGNQIVLALNSYNDAAGNNGSTGQSTFNVDTRFSSSLTAGFYGTTSSSSSANSSVTTNAVIVNYWNPAWQGATMTTFKNGSQIDVFTISGATNSKSLGNLTASPGDVFYSTVTYNGTTYNMFNMIRVNPGTAGLTRYDSPLILDLNGDGVQTVDMAQGTTFDLQATGFAQATGWVNAQDGLLAMDLNKDGKINSGAELFGNSTLLSDGQKATTGWTALAQHDSNVDGKMDARDAVFDALMVWQDTNGNGLTDAGELRSLKDVGVISINLSHDSTITHQNGNLLQGVSSFTTTDGQTHEVVDAWFQTVTEGVQTLQNGESVILPTLTVSSFVSQHGPTGSVDLSGSGANTLRISLQDVLTGTTSGSLRVMGNADDTVQLDAGAWTNSGRVVHENGHNYAVFNANQEVAAQLLLDQQLLCHLL